MAIPMEAYGQPCLEIFIPSKCNIQLTISHILLLFVLFGTVVSRSTITTLPGYTGDLPFKLETGYVSVGELDDVQLFYYFIESEGSPMEDPLLLWLTGGPGCSSFSGLVYEIGPLMFDTINYDGNVPTFMLNPYSWTKIASIIFLDAPVGTGFSYANYSESYITDDTTSAAQTYEFLRKWLKEHSEFTSNAFYVCGDSYAGKVIPIIVQNIYNGNEAGYRPAIKLTGYVLGNPVTNDHNHPNSRIQYAHRMGLLSDKLYEATKNHCHGEYVNVDPNNTRCVVSLELVTKCLERINTGQILEPICTTNMHSSNSTVTTWDRRLLDENNPTQYSLLSSSPQQPKLWCREYDYVLSSIWANDYFVQKALHIREGTIKEWVRCNRSLSYTKNVISSFGYHKNFSNYTNYRALIYSGDHDMLVPYLETHAWVEALNLTIDQDWEPWFVNGQIAGYSMKYVHNEKYRLTYATIKGAGHTAPEMKPEECFAMVYRWLAYYSL